MRHLVALVLLGVSAGVAAQTTISQHTSSTVVSHGGSSVSSSTSSGSAGSVILDNQSSVTSSVTTDGTGAVTRSLTGRTGSTCSAVREGRRCEISCQAPQVAQCNEGGSGSGPACFCR